MQKPAIPYNEIERLSAAREYQILDSEAEKEFDEITQLASEICDAPISIIALIDSERQWFKSRLPLPVNELPRNLAFCSFEPSKPFEPLIVPDMRVDFRFSDHPFVTGEPFLVSYTGIPLTNPDGFVLGMLCVLNQNPKDLSPGQIRSLQMLAKQVIQLLELRKANIRLKVLKEALELHNEELQQFAFVVSHDIKSPLSSILLSSEILRENFGDSIDEGNDQLLKVLNRATFKIKNLVDGILAYYQAERAMNEQAEKFLLSPFLSSIIEMLKMSHSVEISYPREDTWIYINKTALEQIFVNLLQNAIKYNDKIKPQIRIQYSEDEYNYYFILSDNGKGIAENEQKRIFEMFTTLNIRDRFGTLGSGIGLSTVKKLVEKLSGKITVSSKPGEGSVFSFQIKKIGELRNYQRL